MNGFLLVALGSAAGGVARYGLSLLRYPFPSTFPYWTLAANVLGSIAIGVAAALIDPVEGSRLRLLVLTGFCGGFTTFSAFSLETVGLYSEGFHTLALVSVAANLLGSIGGCALGYFLAR